MNFGLRPKDWQTVEALAIKPLQALGALVYVFGSRARGDHKEFSDLDLLYEISKKPEGHVLFKIKDSLVESDLPIKIDLVDFDELADSYRSSALKDRVLV